jgi:broad specificity phosphatase PhoE
MSAETKSKEQTITRIWLVRHGATEWNEIRRAQGQADVPLNEAGRQQAEEAAAQLDGVNVVAVYSSDLSRALDTAEPIARAHDLEVTTDPAFREIDQGDWEGLPIAEIRERWPELWGPARHHVARPGGEAPEQVQKRALEGLARVVKRHPSGTVAIVSHGGTIRWMAAAALGYDLKGSARIRGLSNGGAVTMEATMEGEELRLSGLVRLDGRTADVEDPNA